MTISLYAWESGWEPHWQGAIFSKSDLLAESQAKMSIVQRLQIFAILASFLWGNLKYLLKPMQSKKNYLIENPTVEIPIFMMKITTALSTGCIRMSTNKINVNFLLSSMQQSRAGHDNYYHEMVTSLTWCHASMETHQIGPRAWRHVNDVTCRAGGSLNTKQAVK